jgi:hypothetical protein
MENQNIKSLAEKSFEFLSYRGDDATKLSTLLFIRSQVNDNNNIDNLIGFKYLLENLIDKLTAD